MVLTRQTDIAIAALVVCTKAKGQIVQINVIAKASETTAAHVAQVTRQLARLGWLESHRGRGGGLTLSDGAETLSLGEIVQILQPSREDRKVGSRPICNVFHEAERSKFAYLDRFTIADLARDEWGGSCRENRRPVAGSQIDGTLAIRPSSNDRQHVLA
ncbi:Rrf2 family transcriptional regulator [Agrobacterium sp. OT33]|uniref:RrF2 family transcriptional regulator n=1 Tax=Agrobacterium sp. OT33 TaxID=2815338 RepID=UPI001A8D7DFA|nr:Rrf2 family transcriptional regulator [Agrobacterium sp. OT33]MBO0128362.1 Rrf2 family transcriptional regulator [Agrobacterium sp. OT33]